LTRIRRGERIEHFETIRQHKHGNQIVVSLTISPVKNSEGKVVGASLRLPTTLRNGSKNRSKSRHWLGKQSTVARICLPMFRPW
jgi:hypothetical protein